MASLFFLPSCRAPARTVTLDVVTFNYWSRPIYDVFVDGRGGDSSTAYPATGGSTITGVKLKLGPKTVTWKLDGHLPRSGEMVTARNALELTEIPKNAVFLAVHIYPDETVELIATRHYPDATAKGRAMATARLSNLDRPSHDPNRPATA
jgi:hypothetical protein